MILTDVKSTIKLTFLIPAGSAESNSAVNATFSQLRNILLENFVTSFNEETSSLPGDLILQTTIFVPTRHLAHIDNVAFFVQMPNSRFLFKKKFFSEDLSELGLKFLQVSIYDLFIISVIKSWFVQYNALSSTSIYEAMQSFLFSSRSYTSDITRKNFLFYFCHWELPVTKISFYRLAVNKSFLGLVRV